MAPTLNNCVHDNFQNKNKKHCFPVLFMHCISLVSSLSIIFISSPSAIHWHQIPFHNFTFDCCFISPASLPFAFHYYASNPSCHGCFPYSTSSSFKNFQNRQTKHFLFILCLFLIFFVPQLTFPYTNGRPGQSQPEKQDQPEKQGLQERNIG